MYRIRTRLTLDTAREVSGIALSRINLSAAYIFLFGVILLGLMYWGQLFSISEFLMYTALLGASQVGVFFFRRSQYLHIFEMQMKEKGITEENCAVTTCIDDPRLTQTTLSTGKTMDLSLDDLSEARETLNYIVLVFTTHAMVILDKNGFEEGSADNLKALLDRRAENQKKIA